VIKSTLNFARTAPREVHETEKRDIPAYTGSFGADPRALGGMLIQLKTNPQIRQELVKLGAREEVNRVLISSIKR